MKIHSIIFILMMSLSFGAFAKNHGVAKVIKARGKVYDLSTKKKVKKGMWIKEGAKLQTKSRSFVKLVFIDKSKMSIGPNSKVVINKFPKKKAGIITLMKGQLRSKVTKNYMDMDKSKSKLYIKTKTAAMGVRGTDFQVNYNPENQNTSLITFEGAVAMGSIRNNLRRLVDNRRALEKIVSAKTAVMVRQGQFSGVMPGVNNRPLVPVKINKKQLRALETNSELSKAKVKKKVKSKVAKRSIVPPGLKGSDIIGASKKEVLKEIAKVDTKTANNFKKDAFSNRAPASANTPNSAGENVTIGPKVKEGGIIDTNTVIYIPPPKDAAIDTMTGDPIIPAKLGSFDQNTGAYQNDYYELKSTGEFIQKEITITNTATNDSTRDPASVSPTNTDSNPDILTNEPLPPPPENVYVELKDQIYQEYTIQNYDPATGELLPPPPGTEPINQEGEVLLTEESIDGTLEDRDEAVSTILEGPQETRTKAIFIITE